MCYNFTYSLHENGAKAKNLAAENNAAVELYSRWERTAKTQTTVEDYGSYYLCGVKLTETLTNQTNVILAAYKNGKLVKTEILPYSKPEENFALTVYFDTVRVMVLEDMQAVTELKEIKK